MCMLPDSCGIGGCQGRKSALKVPKFEVSILVPLVCTLRNFSQTFSEENQHLEYLYVHGYLSFSANRSIVCLPFSMVNVPWPFLNCTAIVRLWASTRVLVLTSTLSICFKCLRFL